METRKDGTVFLALPHSMRKPITGGCQCPFCKAHPDLVPMWDTLAGHPKERHTWVVHHPELSDRRYGLDD